MRNWRSSLSSRAAARAVAVTLGRFRGKVKYTTKEIAPADVSAGANYFKCL